MEQFEQLLTCAICLDRYRNPKLLPCQHSFCMEPCMDGLVDYVRRQVKCPECRAEHRIPYQGVQGFPTNVTLQRFLELHIEITGELPDPTSGQIMKRCNVCSEKAYCTMCLHCDKEICPECKSAHKDILRREISRINNQIRRALHRLEDILAHVEKNMIALEQNCTSVSEEVEEIYKRLNKALKDRTEYLRCEIDRYLTTEHKNLAGLKENIEVEISNIQSNCDLADKYMQTEAIEWDDCELMDAKEIFLKTVEFIRYFESETGDYTRRAKFIMAHDPNQLVLHVAGYGDLSINNPHQQFLALSSTAPSSGAMLQPPGPGLMRSKSDHRLASQYRQQEERGYDSVNDATGRVSPLGGRKFGERYGTRNNTSDRYDGRYSRGDRNVDYSGDHDSSYDNEGGRTAISRLRARLGRHNADNADSDSDAQTTRCVRFSDTHVQHAREPKDRERVLDTEDVAKGPLSGITRLYDSPRVMRRLQESEIKKNKKEKEPTPIQQKFQPPIRRTSNTPTVPQRQLSEEDEVSRIKRQNKTMPSTSDALTENSPTTDRVGILKEERQPTSRNTPVSDHIRKTPVREQVSSEEETDEEAEEEEEEEDDEEEEEDHTVTPPQQVQRKHPTLTSRRSSSSTEPALQTGSISSGTPPTTLEKNPPDLVRGEEEDDTETESSTESEESLTEEEVKKKPEKPVTTGTASGSTSKAMEKTDIGPLLARSAQARDTRTTDSRRNSRDDGYSSRFNGSSSYSSSPKDNRGSKYLLRNRSDETETKPRFTSRFLNKSKSTALAPTEEQDTSTRRFGNEPRDHYSTFKDRKSRLARSKSTHGFGDDTEDVEEPGNSYYPSSYYASKGSGQSSSAANDLARSRSTHVLKSRENSPDRSSSSNTGTEKDSSSLSSWARYLKNKYGNRGKEGKDNANTSGPTVGPTTSQSSGSMASRRLSLGLPLRHNTANVDSSDDDQKNLESSPNSPTAAMAAQAGFAAVGTTTARSQYMQKRQLLYKIGSRGSEPGYFTWPRGIAVGPDNSIVVADSSNHRVQVFDNHGKFVKEYGSYGNGENEFDCLAGIAVNRIGQFIIADRYNHRIQVLDPSGRFLRSFGSQGTADGRFNYPWGITTDALGFIYVCDKENHRVQVFQSDGTFVGKFGTCGSKIGQLEHPHYIAVSNTNRVIVSDSNNHRIQIFDVNGRALTTIGSEGSANGQFKFPRGVAVDDQGYILVGDSGNNRIQIFNADGTFLRAFGCWGSGEGEFKGLEGVAVMSNGNILVCDRENHRVQVF